MAFKRRLKFDKRIRFQKKMNIIYILLFIVLASTGIGYAYIKSNLNINGTANVTAARWDVHFTNLNVTTGSVTPTTAASITNPTTVTFAATLDEPNDFYEFTVDVINTGTMDAMIDSFSISPTLTTAQKKYLEYTVTYSDETTIDDKQELKAGTTESLKVRFSYIENSDKTNYPTENQTFTIAFTMNYTQADNTAVEVPHPTYMYTINMYDDIPPNYNRVFIGQAIPNGITQYNNASEALAAFRLETGDNDISFYLKHMLREGIVEASYIEFVITPAMANESIGVTAGTYAIRGFDTRDLNSPSTNYCKEECYNSTTGKCVNPYFESNNEILTRAFGSHCLLNDETYYCNANGLTVFNYIDGAVIIFDELWLCNVTDFGGSNCNVNIA